VTVAEPILGLFPNPANGTKLGALANRQMVRVRAFIEANLHSNFCVGDLSAVAWRSSAYFSRSFKQAFGEPPHAYLMKRRLERAYHLMVTTPGSLSDIALCAGFSDQAHLCRLFQRAFRRTPSVWRRHHTFRASISRIGIEDIGRGNPRDPRPPAKSITVDLGYQPSGESF